MLNILCNNHEGPLVKVFKERFDTKNDDTKDGKEDRKAGGIVRIYKGVNPARGFSTDAIDDPAHQERRSKIKDLVHDRTEAAPVQHPITQR